MQRKRDLPLHGHFPHRRLSRRLKPLLGDTIGTGLRNNLRILGIQKDLQLSFVKILVIGNTGRFLDAVSVLEDDTQLADAPNAGL